MNQNSFTTSFITDKSPETAFQAITNFRAWWSEEIEGKTDLLNETFFYHYKDVHLCKLKMTTSAPNRKFVYDVLDNYFSFTKDNREWKGTKLLFDISSEGGKTKVTFTHQGLTPDDECYNICHESWENYILNSLSDLINQGKGKPNPKDQDGFNAEVVKKGKLKA
jgi:hypothetical protein